MRKDFKAYRGEATEANCALVGAHLLITDPREYERLLKEARSNDSDVDLPVLVVSEISLP
jgi:hypothetical protein